MGNCIPDSTSSPIFDCRLLRCIRIFLGEPAIHLSRANAETRGVGGSRSQALETDGVTLPPFQLPPHASPCGVGSMEPPSFDSGSATDTRVCQDIRKAVEAAGEA